MPTPHMTLRDLVQGNINKLKIRRAKSNLGKSTIHNQNSNSRLHYLRPRCPSEFEKSSDRKNFLTFQGLRFIQMQYQTTVWVKSKDVWRRKIKYSLIFTNPATDRRNNNKITSIRSKLKILILGSQINFIAGMDPSVNKKSIRNVTKQANVSNKTKKSKRY
jgi:hypothetical protein